MTETAIRSLKVEMSLAEFEALCARAAQGDALAREMDAARAAVEASESLLEAARRERDEARAEVRRLSSSS